MSKSINEKLDKLLKAVKLLTERMESFEPKIIHLNSSLDILKKTMTHDIKRLN